MVRGQQLEQDGHHDARSCDERVPYAAANSNPIIIVKVPDSNLWFTEINANNIGKSTVGGVVTEYPIATANSEPQGMVLGAISRKIWFAESQANKVGVITTAGVVSEFAVPIANSGPTALAVGSDGSLWLTERNANQIAKIIP